MATYLGWNIVTMPSSPSPKTIEFTKQDIVGVSTSSFTAQQQTQDWGTSWMEAVLTMPPMTATQAAPWVTFITSLKGILGVFQFPTAGLIALIPGGTVPNGYWRLKSNAVKWSVSPGGYYGLSFEIREAL